MGPSITECTDPVDGTCPVGCPGCVCASPDTPIATPAGDVPIAALRAGDLVYSMHHGALAIVPIRQTHREPVSHHHVVRITLESGAVLEISARHPTADGRSFADLSRGDRLDGVAIQSTAVIPYAQPYTYDVLPDSDSGSYFAGGVLIGSTLSR